MRKIVQWAGSVLLALGVIAAIIFAAIILQNSEAKVSAPAAAQLAADIDLAQCQADAVTAYMVAQGFTEDEFAIGEERVDKSTPEFNRSGPLGFALNGAVADSRESLQALFDSNEPIYQIVADAQARSLPGYDREVVLDAANWQIVQAEVPVFVNGNTGVLNGQQVRAGDTESKAGDAGWIFVDPGTCTVPRSEFDSMGNPVDKSSPESDQPIPFIRVGCMNPGNGLEPKDPSKDPNAQGNAPDGGGENYVDGSGEYIAEPDMDRPSAEPRVNSAPPTPAPPAPSPAPDPDPVPTPDPLPPPPPQPSAPPPSAPESGCTPIPGVEDCS
jgi:K+-transporting ATPase c subunit